MTKVGFTIKISVWAVEFAAKTIKNQRAMSCCEEARKNNQKAFEIIHLGGR